MKHEGFTPGRGPHHETVYAHAAYLVNTGKVQDVEALLAENERLRAALSGIAERLQSAVRDGDSTRTVRALEVARAALAAKVTP